MTTLSDERWKAIRAADLMKSRIASVPIAASTADIERALAEHGVSGLAVRDAEDRIVGIVSWRDLMSQAACDSATAERWSYAYFRIADDELDDFETGSVEHDRDHETCAGDLMSRDLLTISGDASVRELARVMSERRVHRLFVTEPDAGEIVGIVSTMDVLAALSA